MGVEPPHIHVGECPECGERVPPDIEGTTCPYCGSQLAHTEVPALTITSEEELTASLRRQEPRVPKKEARPAPRPAARRILVLTFMGIVSIFLGASHWGFVPWIGTAALTVMHVPVIVGTVLEGPLVGLLIGLVFGGFSLFQGASAPTGPADVWFANPLVSIAPRIFIGPVTWLVYKTLRHRNESSALIVAAVAGSVTNTLLVLGALGFLGFLPWAQIGSIALTNGVPEATIAAIIMWGLLSTPGLLKSGDTAPVA